MGFEKAIETIQGIKLTGGVFGKTTLLLIVLCVSIVVISVKIGTWWFALLLMIPMMGIVLYSLKRVLDFAEKNPQAAIMDGAQLLIHERIIQGTKGSEEFVPIPTIDVEDPPLISPGEAESEDELPAPTVPTEEGQ